MMEKKTPIWKCIAFVAIALIASFVLGYVIYTCGNLPPISS